jgi:hypothetical protein
VNRCASLSMCGLATRRDGVVTLEFLIAFFPTFLLFLAVVQLVLIASATLIVQHAAVVGARAAVVVLDDDPEYYEHTQRGAIAGPTVQNRAWQEGLGERLGVAPRPQASTPLPGGPRMAAIRTAVYARLAAIAPEPKVVTAMLPGWKASLGKALGSQPLDRLWFGMGVYAAMTTAVTFPVRPEQEPVYEDHVDQQQAVTLRVTHLFLCMVPLISYAICDRTGWDNDDGLILPGETDTGGRTARALRELRRAQASSLQPGIFLAGVPVKLLQAEATMASQTAPYLYRSQRAQAKSPSRGARP